MKFSFKIVLLVAVIAIVGNTLTGLMVFYSSRRLLIGRIEKDQLETAFSTMARVGQTMHKAYQDIQLISDDGLLEDFFWEETNFEERSALKARVHEGLGEMVFLTGPWDNLLVVDMEGTIIDSTQEKIIGETIKKFPASNTAFHASLNKRPYYSDLILSDINTRPTVIFASPVTSDAHEGVMAVVIGHFSWPVIMQLLDQVEPSIHAHIFNKDGVTIATPTLGRALILKHSHPGHGLIKKALGGERENSGVFNAIHPELKKEKVFAAVVLEEGFLNYKGNNWGLMLETPLSIIFAPIKEMLKNFVIYTSMGILLMSVAFYFMSQQFIRPLGLLTKMAKAIGSGNLDVRAEVKTKDEIGFLANILNQMAEEIKEKEAEIEGHAVDLEKKVEDRTRDLTESQRATLNIMEDIQESKEDLEKKTIELEKAKAELEDFSKGLESMMESMVEGVIMVDKRGEIVVLNAQSRRMLGFNLTEEIAGKHLAEKMKVIGLYDAFQECQNEQRLITKEITVYQGEKSVVLRCDITPVKEAKGDVIGMVTILRDVTKEKEVDKMKTEFISTVSHELRTPLTTMKEFASIISDEIPGKLTKEQKEYVDIIKGNIDRLARLINDLLDISKIESGKVEQKRTLVDVAGLAGTTLSALKPKADGKHIEVKALFPAIAMNVYADADKITQVFTNLISNAIKFTPEKGKITVEIKDAQEEIECSVTDTGKGISPDDMGKLFGKFQQFGRVDGGGAKGTGLGLAISKELVEMHSGRIWAESKIDEGSKFTFTLPKRGKEDILRETIEEKIAAARKDYKEFSIFIIRLDDYSEGDKELEKNKAQKVFLPISAALEKVIRSGDFVTGKNEIVVFVQASKEEASKLIIQLKRAIKLPILEIEEQFKMGVSYGCAAYPDDADNAKDLLEQAYKSCVREREVRLKKAIMIVDDDSEARSVVRRALGVSGYSNFSEAGNGEEALGKIKTSIPDLLILDMKMPLMNGYELIGMLKENTQTKDIPVLIMSGYTVEINKLEEYVKKKAIPVVGKPLDIEQLNKLVNYLL